MLERYQKFQSKLYIDDLKDVSQSVYRKYSPRTV